MAMKMRVLGAFAIVATLVSTAAAHHSGAGFNSDKVIELTGTIKEFQFTNPHTWIQLIVEDEKAPRSSGASSGARRISWDDKAFGRPRFPPERR
jgi:hypothetical protein